MGAFYSVHLPNDTVAKFNEQKEGLLIPTWLFDTGMNI